MAYILMHMVYPHMHMHMHARTHTHTHTPFKVAISYKERNIKYKM